MTKSVIEFEPVRATNRWQSTSDSRIEVFIGDEGADLELYGRGNEGGDYFYLSLAELKAIVSFMEDRLKEMT